MTQTSTLYTTTAANVGFYMVLAVEAHSPEGAAHLFSEYLASDEIQDIEREEHDMALAIDDDADRTDAVYKLGDVIEDDGSTDAIGRAVVMLSSGANG